MIVTLEQITAWRKPGEEAGENEWLFHEVLRSLPAEVIEQAQQRKEVNVQLMIDNIVVEPQLLNDLIVNIERYIDQQADAKVKERFEELELRFQDIMSPLEDATKIATDKIRKEFNIENDEDD